MNHNNDGIVYPMFPSGKYIADGDIIIMQLTRESLVPITIKAGDQTQNRFGRYLHSDLIGVPYGSKVPASNNKGFVYVLRPTPELWTLSLPHRTQILYIADIAYIHSELGIKPGSVVIEAGTGSGSFSHSVCRAISPNGQLHSFEFHQTRAEAAKVEFLDHGMSSLVKLRHRNVCKEGFDLEGVADAVFLDLPAPWEAIKSAKRAMKTDRITKIVTYSPCIEQVLRTVTMLSKEGFTDITMAENLLRPHSVETQVSLPPISTATTKLRAVETQKEARRQTQKQNSAVRNQAVLDKKRKAEELGEDVVERGGGEEEEEREDREDDQENNDDTKLKKPQPKPTQQPPRRKKGDPIPYGVMVSKPNSEVRGHTSFLVTASLPPIHLRRSTVTIAGGGIGIGGGDQRGKMGGEDGGKEGVDEFDGDDTMGAVLAGLSEEELMALGGAGSETL